MSLSLLFSEGPDGSDDIDGNTIVIVSSGATAAALKDPFAQR